MAMDDNIDDGAAWTAVLQLSPESLARLEQEDLARWREWHEQAIAALASRLRAGNKSDEAVFLAVLKRLGNRLLLDDPEAFASLIDGVADLPLTSLSGRQLVKYFQGVSLARRDQYDAALALFDELLASPELDDYIRGRALNSRALYCRVTGRLQEAVAGYRDCLVLWQQQGNRLREGLAWLNLGNIAHQLQQYDQAETNLQEALVCFQEAASPQWQAAAQNSLGLVYRDRGEWKTAVSFFELVVERRRTDGARDALGRVLVNLSETYLMQERPDKAVETAAEALAALDTKVYAVDAYVALGLSQQVSGDLTAAREAFTAGLDLAVSIGRKDILAEVHYRLGEVWRQLGDNEAALAQWEAAVAVIESTREPLREEGIKISLLGRWQQVYEVLVLHYLVLGRTVDAFLWAEKARARAFLETVGERLEGITDIHLQERLPTIPPGKMILSYFTTGVLNRELPWLRSLSNRSPLHHHLLPPTRTIRFCLTSGGLTVHDCGVDPNALAWDSLRGDDRNRFLDKPIRRSLYQVLLEGIDLKASAHLFISPHGPIHEVPFAALLGEDGRPLLHQNGPLITTIPSVAFWRQRIIRKQKRVTDNCFAVGFDGPSGERLLRHTETEAQFVAEMTGGLAWVGDRPKSAALREQVQDCRWLHIACHGRFLHDAPLDSYLETGLGDRLTAREVVRNWQLQAELVALSACQSGVSRVLRGDEPLGLVRAFLAAGARQVLVSQWAVADLPTFLLMERFYRELIGGADAAAALHAAQLWLQSVSRDEVEVKLTGLPGGEGEVLEGDRPFSHPRHWAAFILVG